MNKEEDKLLVRKIEKGTVIDHIPRGLGLVIYKLLGIKEETCVVLINVESKKFGRKDIIKIENKELSQEDIHKIALLAPNATINIIRNWEVVEKKKVETPEILIGILRCPNSKCITRNESGIETKFIVERKEPIILRCFYCERTFVRDDFDELMK